MTDVFQHEPKYRFEQLKTLSAFSRVSTHVPIEGNAAEWRRTFSTLNMIRQEEKRLVSLENSRIRSAGDVLVFLTKAAAQGRKQALGRLIEEHSKSNALNIWTDGIERLSPGMLGLDETVNLPRWLLLENLVNNVNALADIEASKPALVSSKQGTQHSKTVSDSDWTERNSALFALNRELECRPDELASFVATVGFTERSVGSFADSRGRVLRDGETIALLQELNIHPGADYTKENWYRPTDKEQSGSAFNS